MAERFKIVKLSQVMPDENQPRKYFDLNKLRQLKKSIEKEGIISPLIVEAVGDNYLLLDGERRFRAATELGLKEVPVIIEKAGTKVDRLTRQFQVQEQHENWSPTEKANALISLSEEIGVSVYDVCKLLNVSEGDLGRYVAFSQIVDRDTWVRSEIPLEMSVGVRSLKNSVIRIYEERFQKEFTRNDEKKLERRVIQSIKEGDIVKRSQIIKLKDAFVKNPKLIEEYLGNAKATPTGLYLQAEAQGATALRNLVLQGSYAIHHAKLFLQHRDVKLTEVQITRLKDLREQLDKVIGLAE